MTDEEHEARRWLVECVANMKAKLGLSTAQCIEALLDIADGEVGVLSLQTDPEVDV